MNIISGKLKGRNIPFNNKKFDNAESTPQKVKQALFSILGENLSGKSFLDLYSGSGQIGFEAISRGCKPVILNEIDRKRYKFITGIIDEWSLDGYAKAYNMNSMIFFKFLDSEKIQFDYIYLDPPYEKRNGKVKKYSEILENIGKFRIFKDDTLIIIQHYVRNEMEENAGSFKLIDIRKYGTNGLAFYKKLE
jgi:16S rRNA (guanine966-N2)-methyltransferase